MSTYHGWDREAVLERGGLRSKALENVSGTSLSAFTPINSSRTPAQFVSPQMTLHERDLDEDALDQPNPEITPTVPLLELSVQKGKKRGYVQANRGRAVSIARVWEYRDQGDVAAQNQGADFESSFPKRRKSAPAKRTESTSGQSNPYHQEGEQDNTRTASLHGTEHLKEKQDSQLTIPPDSGKQLPKKAAPKRETKFKPGPFRNPVITKPSVSRETHSDAVVTLTKPVTTYQGWTSTQEIVKHQFNGLSKTTLDKLAAFRYKPSSGIQTDVPSTTSRSNQIDSGLDPARKAGSALPSSDYGSLLSDDPIFVDANCVDQDATKPASPAGCVIKQAQPAAWGPDHIHEGSIFFDDAIWNVHVEGTAADEARSSQNQLLAPKAMRSPQITLQNYLDTVSTGDTSTLASLPLASHAGLMASRNASDYGDPSSSEMRALGGMMSDIVHENHCNKNDAFEEICRSEYLFPDEHCNIIGQDYILPDINPGYENMPTSLHETQADDSDPLPQRHQILGKYPHGEVLHSRHLADVQVERSDNDEPQMTPRDISNDFKLDDFDGEGVEDADLLAIASDAAIPETQPSTFRVVKGKSPRESPLARIHAAQPMVTVAADLFVPGSRPITPEILSDDEYPLEGGLEEEDMISLPTHLQAVIETFQPPLSLEYSSGNGSMSGEVYDKSLQFSPPKSRPSSVLLGKAAGVSLTDKHSPSKVQVVIDLGSDHAEEEDWSFIRSNDSRGNAENPIVTDPASDQENTNPDKIAKNSIPLGPQKQRNRSTYTKLPAATQSSTSQEIVLDDSYDYQPLQPFARPDFPAVVLDRCPILGVTADSFLRVCFRVGEMFREGARCNALKQDAVIELFARVTFSSREHGSTKQHFQFADLWHDRPPFPNGILANYKASGLAESESRSFTGAEQPMMARCIGRLKKDTKNANSWFIEIINIRPTDWEEIKWTKRIVSAGLVKSEKRGA